jgi:SAM-dependent methyltransferase
MEKLTVTWQELKALSDKHFKWHTTHFSRKWEYPWVCSRLAEVGVKHIPVNLRQPVQGRSVLDAGAGMSPVALWAAEQGANVMTVDSGGQAGKGAGFVDYAKYNPAITSYQSDFAKMELLANDSLDALVAISVIEHVSADKRLKAWTEWHRVLKLGGRLILTLDLVGPSDRLLNKREGKRIESNEKHGHLSDLRWELRHIGFTEVGNALCPFKRRWSTRERTTHVIGMVLRKNENQP